ncbi:PREDICTED: zinc finger protein 79-like [Thamnophis sirtalis]|uniref:Zinc finger protein 79-like n=1 Tax=Thamnophis sirtalis TaxID=35019 RepID=A0A6I9YK22_9SAUR|nr:PREDICTED: zinc finger protein 79-like [Thamnophis sirtalis]
MLRQAVGASWSIAGNEYTCMCCVHTAHVHVVDAQTRCSIPCDINTFKSAAVSALLFPFPPAGDTIESGAPEAESLCTASILSKPCSGVKPNPEICGLRQGSGGQPLRWPIKTESEPLLGGNDDTDISQIKIIQVEKKHVCHDCGKAFQYKFELVKHRRTHTGEKPFECLACGKRFFQSTHLNAHLRIHTGEKPYECPRCGRSFNRRSTLTEHLRIHTGEKPYKCLQCGESFRWRPYLTKHQRVHLGENTYRYFDSRDTLYDSSSFPEHQEENQPGDHVTAKGLAENKPRSDLGAGEVGGVLPRSSDRDGSLQPRVVFKSGNA